MKMRKLFSIACLSIALLSCGGGGGSSDPAPPAATWQGPLNANGFPDVAGSYSFSFDTSFANCTSSDGSTSQLVVLPHNVTIEQTASTLILPETVNYPFLTIIDENQMSGTVEKNGHFITNQRIVATTTGTSGQIIIEKNLDGNFTPHSWSGNYVDKHTSPDGSFTRCTTTFSGNKL